MGGNGRSLSRTAEMTLIAMATHSMRLMWNIYCSAGHALVVLSGPPSQSRMNFGVFRNRDKLKVLDAIIRFVAIDVVDMFSRLQRSAKVLFHYVTVLKGICPNTVFNGDVPVISAESAPTPVRIQFPCSRPNLTCARTEVLFPCQRRSNLPFKGFTAMEADANNSLPLCLLRALSRTVHVVCWHLRWETSNQVATVMTGAGDTLGGHRNLNFRCRAGGVTSTARLSDFLDYITKTDPDGTVTRGLVGRESMVARHPERAA